ncbi:MAG TPA: hypothetical protein ENO03_08885, partial [Candidatus Aminicenantes bacterium]|nr:hypothetical protein [Candidatus Aminicenantes bacterium]
MTPSGLSRSNIILRLGLAALGLASVLAGPVDHVLAAAGAGPGAPTSLRCEYLVDPMGIDMAKPRFFWVVAHPERGQAQSAYRIVVSSEPGAEAGDVWDSGRILSSKSGQIPFAGEALESGRSY